MSLSRSSSRPVTLRDIAQRCGVSRITVSYALRGDRSNVSQTVMDRIAATANEMGYNPALTQNARRLRYQHSAQKVENHIAALFFPVFLDSYWTLIFSGISKAFREEQYGVLVYSDTPPRDDFPQNLPFVFHRGEIDGALICTGGHHRELVDGLSATPGFGTRPIVTMLERVPGHAAVIMDDVQAGYQAARHLLELGHRGIMRFEMSNFQFDVIRNRALGHDKAVRDMKLDPAEVLVTAPWIWRDARGLNATVEELVKIHPDVTGILCPNDSLGVQLAQTLVGQGYRIPEEVSLIGVDDCEVWPEAGNNNRWTTVRMPLHDLGVTSARLLLERIRDDAPDVATIQLPVELTVRGSTAPPRRRPGS